MSWLICKERLSPWAGRIGDIALYCSVCCLHISRYCFLISCSLAWDIEEDKDHKTKKIYPTTQKRIQSMLIFCFLHIFLHIYPTHKRKIQTSMLIIPIYIFPLSPAYTLNVNFLPFDAYSTKNILFQKKRKSFTT